MGKPYFVCYRKDGEMENFHHRCTYVNSAFNSNAVAFMDRYDKTLAIIPIHNIEAIMRYEEVEQEGENNDE